VPIYPLPQFEADVKAQLAEDDRKTYEALKAPKTLVVRFGGMKLIGEFQHTGTAKPGCGSKVVVRTFRGTELGEMLTSTCPNSGCSKSVSRQDMLEYIENSGGNDYPFYTEGKVVRMATTDDLDKQAKIEQSKHELKLQAKQIADRFEMPLKIVEVEPILGGESVTVFYATEQKLEVRDLARELGQFFRVRVEMRGVGARDEARLTADYEKCGQYCCCKNFLKVLKPVSMKSAKVQKATLDPLKISGRCGRLMCCLRYEDETYESLSKKLPRKKSRVGTPEGDGLVIDGQILTQLVLVLLDEPGTDGKDRQVAIPVENLSAPKSEKAPVRAPMGDDRRGPGGGGGSGGQRGERPRSEVREREPRRENARENLPEGGRGSGEPRGEVRGEMRGPGPREADDGGERAGNLAGDASEWGEDAGPRDAGATSEKPVQQGGEPRDQVRDQRPRDDRRPRRDDRPRDGRGPRADGPRGGGQPREGQPPANPSASKGGGDSVDDLMSGDLLADDPMRGGGDNRWPRRDDRGGGGSGGGGGRRRRRRGGGGSGGGGGPRPGGPPTGGQ